jgi:glycosyltransferase involved in cell wall biosynthesis
MRRFPVAHLIASNFYGGPERQIVTHARYARERGYAPVIMSFAENGNDNAVLRKAEEAGLDTHLVHASGPFDPSCVRRLCAELRRRDVRVLVSHGYKANVVGRLASWLARVPKVAVSRGWTAETLRVRLYERLDRVFLRRADHVVAVSDGQAVKLLQSGVPRERLTVIRNSIDLDAYPGPCEVPVRRQLGLPENALLVATAGRLSPEKNQRDLVAAAELAVRECDSLFFAVCGDGAMREELEAMARHKGLSGRFLFLGFRRDVRSLLHGIDIFVLPSLTEGLPNVVLEACACAKPVVATAVGGTPEVVEHGETGYLVPPGDPAAIARRIVQLAKDPDRRRRMGGNGRILVERQFDYPAQTEQYHRLYQWLGAGTEPTQLCGVRA